MGEKQEDKVKKELITEFDKAIGMKKGEFKIIAARPGKGMSIED